MGNYKIVKQAFIAIFITGIISSGFQVQAQTDLPDSHPNYGYYQYRNQFYNKDAMSKVLGNCRWRCYRGLRFYILVKLIDKMQILFKNDGVIKKNV